MLGGEFMIILGIILLVLSTVLIFYLMTLKKSSKKKITSKIQRLHPGARWLFRFKAYGSLIFFFVFLIVLQMNSLLSSLISGGEISEVVGTILYIGLIGIGILVISGEIYSRLAYANWGYEFTDTELKTEKGIVWKKYSNVPYARIQNVEIQRGILARLFGFSTLYIQTAGAHYTRNGTYAEGQIPAVDLRKAEEIRTNLMKRITSKGM